MNKPILVVFGGLPGSCKTTIAKALAQKMVTTYLRVDTIEKPIITHSQQNDIGSIGYEIMVGLAEENLLLGQNVIVDCVNPLQLTRKLFRDIAKNGSLLEVEIVCSNLNIHRHRIEKRNAYPHWSDVISRSFETWPEADLTLDTACLSVEESVSKIIEKVKHSFA